jgi:serine/threonine protein kinase
MIGRHEKSIFLSALECDSPEQRLAYLANACGTDAELRIAVERLLIAADRPDNLLDQAIANRPDDCQNVCQDLERLIVAESSETAEYHNADAQQPVPRSRFRARESTTRSIGTASIGEASIGARPNEWIDRYRLREKIGEGGFGEVFVAEQHEPVRRRVALKLLKPGMNSREVVQRFEAERQALAMMEHPHIAQILDAGTTSGGQPFVVMELVRGVPLTAFCNEHQLTTPERLELFIKVCHAVQHAHQKGIIHRDLKPSNVLVTKHDVTPIPKVIDFGIAKAVGGRLTDQTIYTRFMQMIGTPMYMSPEQAELNGLDVDTRSDVYSLGVMLYELLTGTTPFDPKRLDTATFDELRRMIREEEPPRPSARLAVTGAKPVTTAAVNQRTDARTLTSRLRGDLDWIVMKSLEKDRQRRYESASDLARDLTRYLNAEPVLARPPSPWYRWQKFARRNKVAFTTASLVLLTLLAGTTISTWQAVRATQAQAEADTLRAEAVEFANRLKLANVLLDSARANADEQRWDLALAQYTRATELQPDHYLAWSGRGSLYLRVGSWDEAAKDYATALQLGAPANNPGWWGVPQLCLFAGQTQAYQQACERLASEIVDSEDATLVTLAVRSLVLRDIPTERAKELAERMERLCAEVPVARGPHPHFNQSRPHGPPRLEGSPIHFPGGFRNMPLPRELIWYVAGLAHLRAGDSEKALSRLEGVLATDHTFPAARIVYPPLALALHQAGRQQDAQRMLDASRDTLDEWTTRITRGGIAALPFPWFDYLESMVLYQEAASVVR